MKNTKVKIFSGIIVTIVALFLILFLLQGNQAKIKLNKKTLDYDAYSMVNKEELLSHVDEEESDYDTLNIYLTNDDFEEFNIDEQVQSIYDSFDLELKNTNLLPFGKNVTVRYEATKKDKNKSEKLKAQLDDNTHIKLFDQEQNEILLDEKDPTYIIGLDDDVDEVLEFSAYHVKFDDLLTEIPLTVDQHIESSTSNEYQLILSNLDYQFNKEINIIVEEGVTQAEGLDDIQVLVNKKYHLGENDVPELKDFPIKYSMDPEFQAQPVAVDAFIDLVDTMKAETDMIVVVNSAYRSYQYQVGLFNTFANREGIEAANKFSARAGESEHQTGLAIDVTKPGVFMDDFGTTEESVWVAENAHRFGFIIRFPEGKDDITGYQYEPWHLRYLGEDLAKKVKDSGLTYDEYWVAYLR